MGGVIAERDKKGAVWGFGDFYERTGIGGVLVCRFCLLSLRRVGDWARGWEVVGSRGIGA